MELADPCHDAGMAEKLEPAIDRYPNGNVRHRGANLDGQMHGPWEFFRADGSIMGSGAFDRGRRVGVWKTYDRDGKVVKETKFPPEPKKQAPSASLHRGGLVDLDDFVDQALEFER
jgi:hypothetical protein